MWTYIIGPVLSLLPKAWRAALVREEEFHWSRATFISGLVIGVGCMLALIGWYLHFLKAAVQAQMDVTLQATKGVPGEGAAYAMGFAGVVLFFMQPLTWVLAYFSIEGIFRAVAAGVTEESPASLPFVALAAVTRAVQKREYEYRVPLVADAVTRGEGKEAWDLRVASCRPKLDWITPLTIRYHDEFFKVVGESQVGTTPARPHVYLLKRVPPHEALRGVGDYSPEDSLTQETQKPPGLGSAFADWKERRRMARLPRVADRVIRGGPNDNFDLKIESCRPKPQWTTGRTIQFEGVFYRLESDYAGSPQQPFGFVLKRVPPNEAIRGPLAYDPDEPLHY
jgi:hypothetical protein